MNAFTLLYGDWPLIVVLAALFTGAYVFGRILFVANNELAIKILEKLDTGNDFPNGSHTITIARSRIRRLAF